MKPYAYVCIRKSGDMMADVERLGAFCRAVYDAGCLAVCPSLVTMHFIDSAVPEEHADGISYTRKYLRYCDLLVLCDKEPDETMKMEIDMARKYGIPATTLEGIQMVRELGHATAE